jgi:hypothetical protein
MGREPDFHFEFPKRFEIEILERLRPRPYDEGYTRSLCFPGGGDLDPQQELAEPPILSGFDAPANASREFTVDLRTGQATDRPYP